jgi:hypothetical protein
MPLTAEEKVKIRHHTGYLNVQAVETFVLGAPAGIETSFIIEGAMNRILPEAEGEVRRHLAILDATEAQMLDDRELLAVNKVDELGIRPTEMKELRNEYLYWRMSLCNLLGVYPNPFDRRFANMGINVAVQ